MTRPVRIPADVHREDRIVGQFTARQIMIGSVTAAVVYAAWVGIGPTVGLPVFALLVLPVVAVAVAVALGRRDGLPLDQWLLAAARHHLHPQTRTADTRTNATINMSEDEVGQGGPGRRQRRRFGSGRSAQRRVDGEPAVGEGRVRWRPGPRQ